MTQSENITLKDLIRDFLNYEETNSETCLECGLFTYRSTENNPYGLCYNCEKVEIIDTCVKCGQHNYISGIGELCFFCFTVRKDKNKFK